MWQLTLVLKETPTVWHTYEVNSQDGIDALKQVVIDLTDVIDASYWSEV